MSQFVASAWPVAPAGEDRLTHRPTVVASIQYWTDILQESKRLGDWEREKTAFLLIESLQSRL